MKTQAPSLNPITAALLFLLPLVPAWGEIPEPETICYGKVLNTGSEQSYMLTDGELSWSVGTEGGDVLSFKTKLQPIADGDFSYRLKIPHEALSLGLLHSRKVIPLGGDESSLTHSHITVNGLPARILPPADDVLTIYQARRAGTQRIDLLVGFTPEDSDGDGQPDWWEDRFGLDKQQPDAQSDLDGDGLSNLAEFHAGSDPNADNRTPQLITTLVHAYAEGASGVLLQTLDSDSSPQQLVYTLTKAPLDGELCLRNAAPQRSTEGNLDSVDLLLSVGATFTQEDVNHGHLIFALTNSIPSSPVSFEVAVRDESPEHAEAKGEIAVEVYHPSQELLEEMTTPDYHHIMASLLGYPSGERDRAANYLLAKKHRFVVWDHHSETDPINLSVPTSLRSQEVYQTDYVPSYGEARPQLLLGGHQSDRLSGGMSDDILIGGLGDDEVTGAGGRDQFVFQSREDGNDKILDFNPEEGDLIDLSLLLRGSSKLLSDYVELSILDNGTVFGLDVDGDGSGFSDVTITLVDTLLDPAALPDWLENGNLIVNDLYLPTRLTVLASVASASENGPKAGTFTLTRSGSIQSDLEVNVVLSGSATNGVDYAHLANKIIFPANERSVTIEVMPFADGMVESEEVVELIVMQGEGYNLGEGSVSSQLVIEDLQVQLELEVLEAIAAKDSQSAGAVLLRRSGVLDRSVFVRLEIGGSAINGTDYEAVPIFMELAAGETSKLIEITPKAGATLEDGAETVDITILTDESYRLGDRSSARVTMVGESMAFQTWLATNFPDLPSGDLAMVAAQDPGNRGIPILVRYAFGLDAQNPDARRLPHQVLRDGHLTIYFEPLPTASDLDYVVEVSGDLVQWSASSEDVEQVITTGDGKKVAHRARRAVIESSQSFMRVKVVYRP